MESYNFRPSSCIMRPVRRSGGVLGGAQHDRPSPFPGAQLIDRRGAGALGNWCLEPIPG